MRNKLPDGSDVLAGTEPQVNLQLLAIVDLADVNSKMLEGALQGTLRTLDGDFAGLDVNSD